MTLRQTAFRDPRSFFRKYAEIDEDEALSIAEKLWTGINLPNLQENILPTRQRASLILTKGASHRIQQVALRRLSVSTTRLVKSIPLAFRQSQITTAIDINVNAAWKR
jgi:hypothetical protein